MPSWSTGHPVRNLSPDPADERRESIVGAPWIHGELLKFGIEMGQTSVAKYMARRRRPPSEGWRTLLRNHADGIAAMDLFVVPAISFRLLDGLPILRHGRRRILWLGVTTQPTAEWIAKQSTESIGWQQVPQCMMWDRDTADCTINMPGLDLQ